MTTIPIGSDDVVAGIVAKLESLPALPKAVEMPEHVPDKVMAAAEILDLLGEWAVLLESHMEQADQGLKWTDGLWAATAVPAAEYVVGL